MKKTAQIVIINELNQVLCVSRKHDHTLMGLPGGKMEESDYNYPIITAIRETYEETGIKVKPEDLELVFLIHKHGFMSYTYYTKVYSGIIEHNEPHLAKWGSWKELFDGPFGDYNKLVYDSLLDMDKTYDENILNIHSCINCKFYNFEEPTTHTPYPEYYCIKGNWDTISSKEEYESLFEKNDCVSFEKK